MDIYLIEQYDTTSENSSIHSAYEDKKTAELTALKLNGEEEDKREKYDEWVSFDTNDDSESPEFGDQIYTVTKTMLHTGVEFV